MQPLMQQKSKKYYMLEYMFVAIGTQHVMRTVHIVICGLSRFTILLHITS
jgi:hypothetical protein